MRHAPAIGTAEIDFLRELALLAAEASLIVCGQAGSKPALTVVFEDGAARDKAYEMSQTLRSIGLSDRHSRDELQASPIEGGASRTATFYLNRAEELRTMAERTPENKAALEQAALYYEVLARRRKR